MPLNLRPLKDALRQVPLVGDAARALYRGFRKPTEFDTSASYWEERYGASGDSGDGSYGRLAAFKAEILNGFVAQHGVGSLVEFGCGDGAQLTRASYPRYLGLDVSATALEICRTKFANDDSKTFAPFPPVHAGHFDLALSLDVIYHLVEDQVFHAYMSELFAISDRWVIIYSSNDPDIASSSAHIRHRRFTDWIDVHAKGWELRDRIAQRFPLNYPDNGPKSFADFYIFERVA